MLLPRISPSAPLGAAALALLFGLLPSSLARTSEPAESVASVDAYYNPEEERGSFEMKMKPYPIPVETTTYVSFVFNLPKDLPDMFHMALGEVLKSKYPQHLHHFVLSGCTDKIDADLEGMPLTQSQEDAVGGSCLTPMGGWAPGAALFGNVDNDTGILWGRGLGIEAVLMNVHYTDGAYEDPASMVHKMAEDGIRVHYTPDFRPYTTVPKSLINVGTGAGKMAIPPGEPRFYITRTCKVGTSCKDVAPEMLGGILPFLGISAAVEGDVSCASAKSSCDIPWIQRFCPATCGFCAETLAEGHPNPLNPDGYRVTGINYHAHLLGREMYATLLHEEGVVVADDADSATAVLKNAPVPTAEDLQSAPIWIYDLQITTPLEGEVVQDDAVLQGARVKPGDKIQVTCVYDSTAREGPTQFDISTYDEMCITTVHVTFATPASLSGGGGTGAEGFALDPAMELSLLAFDCDEDDETDIHVGTLAPGEDAKDIWLNHPIADAEGCTFPHTGLGLDQWQVRCPDDDGESLICPGQKLLSNDIAGSACTGGTLDGKDSNDGTTEAACAEGGGVYTPYTCAGVEHWLNHEAEANGLSASDVAFLAEFTYRPKCCAAAGSFICDDGLTLLAEAEAGRSCTGGTLDQKDSNDGTTEAACVGGGGVYAPYTCAEADHFLEVEAEAFGINNEVAMWVAQSWYQSKCCGAADADENTQLDIEVPMDSEQETEASSEQKPEGALGGAAGTDENTQLDIEVPTDSEQKSEASSEQEPEGASDADVKTEQMEPRAESTAPVLMLRPVLAVLLCVAAAAPAILL